MTFHTNFQWVQKPLKIRYDKIDGFIKVHYKIRYLVLFDYSYYYDKICNKIRYLISGKSGSTDSINHNFAYESLPIEKILNLHNRIIVIKSVVNKNKNEYLCNIFLENGLYNDESNTEYSLRNVCIL